MKRKLCPKCGETRAEFVGAFCSNCFGEKKELFKAPRQLELRECASCNKLFLRGEWVDASDKQLAVWLASKIKSGYALVLTDLRVTRAGRKATASFTVNLNADGVKVSRPSSINLNIDSRQCRECSLRSGGYHEAVLQVRGTPSQVERFIKSFKYNLKGKTFITSELPVVNGVDLQVGERRPAFQVISKMRVHNTKANKLVGKKDGKNLVRTTICVRL
ncbi:MAG: NMD3-related protein [Candidatus Micrarchaeota archaeon]